MAYNMSLIKWLSTFELDGRPSVEVSDGSNILLASGFICARILNQICPEYFTEKWLEGIKPVPPNGSWRLRVSNLKRITQKIYDFASDLQSPQFRPTAISPNVVAIAQVFDHQQICRLIQLILFCAISCEKKQHYVDRIHNLPTDIKQNIKEAIEELLVGSNEEGHDVSGSQTVSKYSPNESRNSQNSYMNLSSSHSRDGTFRLDSSAASGDNSRISGLFTNETIDTPDELKDRLFAALAINEQKAQAYHELECKMKHLLLEKETLQSENARLVGEASDKVRSTPRRASDTGKSNHGSCQVELNPVHKDEQDERVHDTMMFEQNRKLQLELQSLKGELIKLESEKEDYRLKSNLLKDDLDKLTSKNEQLKIKAERAKRLQDELDEHKHMLEKIQDHEGTIGNLVKKSQTMKKELKCLEEKNASYIQQIVSLEAEKNQLLVALGQIDVYKQQLHEAQVKLSEEIHRADKAEIDLTRLSEKFQIMKRENEQLFETASQLRRASSSGIGRVINSGATASNRPAELSPFEAEDIGPDMVDEQQSSSQSLAPPIVDLKERIIRLQSENRLLNDKLKSKRELEHSSLSSLLESANSRCIKLESENRQARKKLLILETNMKEQNSDNNVLGLINRVGELQTLLFQKEHEIFESDAKYARNLHKAKELIKGLSYNKAVNTQSGSLQTSAGLGASNYSSIASSSLDEIRLLKQQVKARESRIIELEREFYEFKKIKEIHERLILSAFYSLTTPIQWRNADKRLERTSLTCPPSSADSTDDPQQRLKQRSNHSH